MATLRQFIAEIGNTKEELLDKEIFVRAENGLLVEPKLQFLVKELSNFDLDADNVEKIIIGYF